MTVSGELALYSWYGLGGVAWLVVSQQEERPTLRSILEAPFWPLLLLFVGMKALLRRAREELFPSEEKRLRKELARVRQEQALLDLRCKVAVEQAKYDETLNQLLGT